MGNPAPSPAPETISGPGLKRLREHEVPHEAAALANKLTNGDGQKAPRESARKACMHSVAVPDGFDRSKITLNPDIYGTLEEPKYDSAKYVKQYPFVLDPFQATAIACVERDESVMVAAHTSAGKTAIAEYAVAVALRRGQRVLYTSPLKALSNQKFRELQEEFQDVGLMTGDVSVNENASCVVMTTEILRSMLYKGSEMTREVAWVIFDEIHYMQDRERGVVWEETIISMPRGARCAFLSATLSNASEFAAWVAALHQSPCHVVYTDYRPVPLEHFVLPCGHTITEGKSASRARFQGGLYKVCTKDGEFSAKVWADAAAAGTIQAAWDQQEGEGNGPGTRVSDDPKDAKRPNTQNIASRVVDVLKLAQERELYPLVCFAFNRLQCESLMLTAWAEREKSGKLDFTTAEEKEQIEEIYHSAIADLGEDAELPAIRNVLRFLRCGLGVHHGGLIPRMKELVEILFQENLIKVLFATETFAMGLNMPARAVVFCEISKHDGEGSRSLTSGEYIQMSGRAGRRGKDDRGYSIIICEDLDAFSPAKARAMILGKAMPLISRFRLSYYTLLNLTKLREGGMDRMEYLIANSFQQFQHSRALPAWQRRVREIEEELASAAAGGGRRDTDRNGKVGAGGHAATDGATAADELMQLMNELAAARRTVQAAATQPDTLLPFLPTGRLVRVQEGATDWGWGVVIATSFKGSQAGAVEGNGDEAARSNAANWQAIVLLSVTEASMQQRSAPQPAALDDPRAELVPIPAPLALIVGVGKDRIAVPADVRPAEARRKLLQSLHAYVIQRCKGADHVPLLHPVQDLKVAAPEVARALERAAELERRLGRNAIAGAGGGVAAAGAPLAPGTEEVQRLQALAVEREALKARVSRSHLDDFRDEVAKRRAVLRRLGHLTPVGLLTTKGAAAAEVDTADELLTAELLFTGVWQGLSPPHIVALLSMLIEVTEIDGGAERGPCVAAELADSVGAVQRLAREIADVSQECGLELDKDKYIARFTVNLMQPLFSWARGASFATVTESCTIYEGTLIRGARRLTEVLMQIVAAAERLGELEMKDRMSEALESLRRDIMFANSLYL